VPEPGKLDEADRELLVKVEGGFQTVGDLYAACQFRAALNAALALAREANVYLDRKAPWFQIKEDKAAAATTVYVILRVVDNLKTLLAPILPHTAQQLHGYLGYEGQLFGTQTGIWATRASFSGRRRWWSTRKRPERTRRSPTITAAQWGRGHPASCCRARRCVSLRPSSRSWTRAW